MEKMILSLTLLFSTSAMAEKSVFGNVTPEQPVCYGREYSFTQLKNAPHQTVQKIQVKLSKIKKYDQNIMEAEITLKGEKNAYKNFRSFFICEKDGRCQIECDGGSAQIQFLKDGNLILKNENFAIEGDCGAEEERQILKAIKGGDDQFKLIRLPTPFCQNVTDHSN